MPEPINNSVLRQILENPKFAEFNPVLLEEAYDVMLRLAPGLAKITAIAGHWVREVLAHGFVNVAMVKALCDAELAYTDANNLDIVKGAAQDAFFAGVVWRSKEAVGLDEPIHEAFERWWASAEQEDA